MIIVNGRYKGFAEGLIRFSNSCLCSPFERLSLLFQYRSQLRNLIFEFLHFLQDGSFAGLMKAG
jgi:hypothetical protein